MPIQPFKDNPMVDDRTEEDEERRTKAVWNPVLSSQQDRPVVVCLCGSTRFGREFAEINLQMTLEGKIVLSIGCNMRDDNHIFEHYSQEEKDAIKERLDSLHLAKIEMADEVFFINRGGYIGTSTFRELVYAMTLGKVVRFLEPVSEIVRPS